MIRSTLRARRERGELVWRCACPQATSRGCGTNSGRAARGLARQVASFAGLPRLGHYACRSTAFAHHDQQSLLASGRFAAPSVPPVSAAGSRPRVRSAATQAQSVYPRKPDDPRAVEFNREAGRQADGISDDADALQQAINRVQGSGVVFIPEGRYRLGKTVYVNRGIRLIGFGAKRPVFVLGANTPGFQQGERRYMVQFTDQRSQPGQPVVDGSEFTFYSGMSNIDFELQEGNPAAIAVRFHVAQHSMLTYMDFNVGSARAAVEDVGNQVTNVRIHGGDYGIITPHRARSGSSC